MLRTLVSRHLEKGLHEVCGCLDQTRLGWRVGRGPCSRRRLCSGHVIKGSFQGFESSSCWYGRHPGGGPAEAPTPS